MSSIRSTSPCSRVSASQQGVPPVIKVFFASDFHVSQTVWNRFLKTPGFLGVNALICGGDITGKMIVPLIEQANGTYSYYLHGRVQEARSEQELAAAEAKISSGGYYPYRTSPEEVEVLERVETARTKLFERLMKERVERWISQAADRVARHIPIYVMPGNDDSWAIEEALGSNDRVVNARGRLLPIGEGLEMATFAWVNPTPWNTPREAEEGRPEIMLEDLFSRVRDPSRLVANLHAPRPRGGPQRDRGGDGLQADQGRGGSPGTRALPHRRRDRL